MCENRYIYDVDLFCTVSPLGDPVLGANYPEL